MDNKAQGAFEYILLLAGVLLIVILVIVILRGSILGSANNQINANAGTWGSLTNCSLNTSNPKEVICTVGTGGEIA